MEGSCGSDIQDVKPQKGDTLLLAGTFAQDLVSAV